MTELVRIDSRQNYGISEFLSNFTSPQTRKAYSKDLESFFGFLSFQNFIPNKPSDICTFHFIAYRDFLLEHNKSPASINRSFSTLRSLWTWFLKKGIVSSHPINSVKLPRSVTKTPTEALTDEEARLMIDSPDLNTFHGKVHRIALVFLFYTGIRRSELVNIKLKDIKKVGDYLVLTINGKGGKSRSVPLVEEVAKELANYIAEYKSSTGSKLSSNDYILQSYSDLKNMKPYNPNTLYKFFKRYSKKNNIEKNISPHSSRATVITKAIEDGAPITEVADLAGHSSITTTQIYWKRRKGLDSSPLHKLNYSS